MTTPPNAAASADFDIPVDFDTVLKRQGDRWALMTADLTGDLAKSQEQVAQLRRIIAQFVTAQNELQTENERLQAALADQAQLPHLDPSMVLAPPGEATHGDGAVMDGNG